MAGTYSKIYIQAVFAVKGRQCLIHPDWKDSLNKYICGIISNKGQKPIIINGVADHIHCFFGMKASMLISDLVRDIKNNSSKFINESGFIPGRFQWQEGFGAFSYSENDIGRVYDYILHQEEHHRKITFKEEYIDLLDKFQIEYKPEYLFEWI